MYKEKLKILEELLIERDKVNGNWKHDSKGFQISYCIKQYRNQLGLDCILSSNAIFIFKSREICEKFYLENIDKLDLIKEFI